MRHSDAVGSGKGEDSQNYDINSRDSEDQTLSSADVDNEEDTDGSGNPSTVDASDDPNQ